MPRRWGPRSNASPAVQDDCQGYPKHSLLKPSTELMECTQRRCVVGAPADLFAADQQRFVKSMDVVKFNFSFHDRQLELQQYESWSGKLVELGLTAVVKASRLATHENQLAHAEDWWPRMRAAYAEFHKRGVLEAVLWQCAPSLQCTAESLKNLEKLCKLLYSWSGTRQVFEFRHDSWYNSRRALEILRQYDCCLAWLNLHEHRLQWTDADGWSLREITAKFLYLQLHGSEGRALGSYSEDFLQQLAQQLPQDRDVIILFCQVDVPMHAWYNAATMRKSLGLAQDDDSASQPAWSSSQAMGSTSGRIVKLSPRLVILDVDGHTGILGRSHLRSKSLVLRVGDIMHGLCIQAVENQRVWLSEGQVSKTINDSTSDCNESLADLLKEIDDHVFGIEQDDAAQRWGSTLSDVDVETRPCRTSEISAYLADATVDGTHNDGVHVSLSSGLSGSIMWESLWGGKQSNIQVGETITVLVQRGGRTADDRISMAMPRFALNPWAPRVQDDGQSGST